MLARIAFTAVLALAAPAAAAERYPERPITMVVPYAAGGSSDILARLLGERLAKGLRQPIAIDDRAGAGNRIGIEVVAHAAADGYTLLLADMPHAIIPATLATASAALDSGAVRALAIAGEQRLASRPAIPILRDAGIDLVVEHWWGVLAPAGLAPTIAARLTTELRAVLDTPEFATRLQPLGVAPAHMAPEQFRALIASDTARWADIIKAAGITVQ